MAPARHPRYNQSIGSSIHSPSAPRPVIIVGGGISGLSAAWFLRQKGIPATIVERAPRLGGVIATDEVEGCLVEAGPDSFLAAKTAAADLIRAVGLGDEIIGSNDSRRVTYILRKRKLIPMPDGLMMMVPTKAWPMIKSPLLGWGTKLRMGLELLRRPAEHPDRSVADFVEDHFGRETVEYLAEPLLAGVYGGDPAKLSVRSTLTRFVEMEAKTGSLARAMLQAPKHAGSGGSLFHTLKRGMGSLVDALRPSVHEVIQGEAEALEPGGRVRVNGEWLTAQHVILACPAYESARLIGAMEPDVAALLKHVDYSTSVTMAFGFRRTDLDHPLNGFGFLVPRKERGALVACTWVGTKFNHRVPDSHALLRCFLTSDADQEAVLLELQRIMGFTARPAFVRTSRWVKSMAQYLVGHEDRQRELDQRMSQRHDLMLIGNAYHGIGVPDCIRLANQAVNRITSVHP
ncbi:MAG: protoporphyrinogen oxidase [Bryobacterales bacterium]|nr:protoporphyrinogen oxidase [Bryobacterales bacterium]